MLTLAIDTSTELCSIALGENGTLRGELNIEAGRSHLEMLLPGIHQLLTGCGAMLDQIDCFLTGTGPGTFSGLRVGIASARALAQARRRPLAGSSSLLALARGMAQSAVSHYLSEAGTVPWLLPLIDAKRGEVFAQLYKVGDDGLKSASAIMCLAPRRLVEQISGVVGAAANMPAIRGNSIVAAGNGALAYYEELAAGGRLEIPEAGDPRHRLRAAHHLPAAEAACGGGFDPAALLKVLPVYVRDPDADKTALLRKKESWH